LAEIIRNAIWEKEIKGFYVVVCHFAMRVWPRSHFNSWQLYGHSHGKLPPIGKQWDIGVDNNDFYPVSFNKICEIIADRPDNPNFAKNIVHYS
jgi:calcineurin-like phosphoesterase family protein